MLCSAFQILNFVRVAVQSRKVNLLSIDSEVADSIWYELPIDTKLQEFTISLSGPDAKVVIKNPEGQFSQPTFIFKWLMEFREVLGGSNTDEIWLSSTCLGQLLYRDFFAFASMSFLLYFTMYCVESVYCKTLITAYTTFFLTAICKLNLVTFLAFFYPLM